MKYTRICKICGTEFSTNHPAKLTCSPACSYKNSQNASKAAEERRNQRKRKPNPLKTQSLCLSCRRAYAKPFSAGGCEKFLYGTEVYRKAHWVLKEPQRTDPYRVLIVEVCDLYEPDYLDGRRGLLEDGTI